MEPKALLWQISTSTPLIITGNSLSRQPVKCCENNKNTLKHLNSVSAVFFSANVLEDLNSSKEMGNCSINLAPPLGNESRLSNEDREWIQGYCLLNMKLFLNRNFLSKGNKTNKFKAKSDVKNVYYNLKYHFFKFCYRIVVKTNHDKAIID